MTNEIRANANSEVSLALESVLSDRIVKARVGKKNCYLYKTDVLDEAGRVVWVELDVTVKSNDPTKTHDAFDPITAMDDRSTFDAEQEQKEKSPKKSKGTAVNNEVAKRKEDRKNAIRNWASTAEKDVPYTTTDIFNAINDTALFPIVPTVSPSASELVSEGVFDKEQRDGKWVYIVR